MSPLRVLVVDDSVVARLTISKSLKDISGLEVIDTATDGRIALKKIPAANPDLVILDLEMPEMDGLATLQAIKAQYPTIKVIFFSATNPSDRRIKEARAVGLDAHVEKPTKLNAGSDTFATLRRALFGEITALFPNKPLTECAPATPRPATPKKRNRENHAEIVAIGSSTGGPEALPVVLSALPASFPVPIVMVQHMPPVFTGALASRLNKLCALEVHEAQGGECVLPGHVWLAPGGHHLEVRRKGTEVYTHLTQAPPEQGCRPAVDVLFRSLPEAYHSNILAVILTGMGQDGLAGSRKIIKHGGTLLAQDESSSVVWGMPGAVSKAQLPEKVLPLTYIGQAIVDYVTSTIPIF